MNQLKNSEKFQEIINSLNNKKYEDALNKIKILSAELPNNKVLDKLWLLILKMDWKIQ